MSEFQGQNEHYCIRTDYIPNKENITYDLPNTSFWTAHRIQGSYRYQWHIYKWAQRIAKENKVNNVLDIGCGPATKLMSLISPVATVYGIDQPSAIEYCIAQYGEGHYFSDNFEDPSLELDVHFGLIICSDVIEHMQDPDMLLRYIKRFCARDTLICISTPDRERLRGRRCANSPKKEHVREWSSAEFRCYLAKSGFEIVDQRHFPPVKTELGKLFFLHLAYQLLRGRPYLYNQGVICRLK
jgi:2-polyprenyl-3-methyl-5-hydroxy-6-metoxy-1,4-benzoquinol methylase